MRLRLGRTGEPRTAVYRLRLMSFGLATNAAKRDAPGMIGCRATALAHVYGHQMLDTHAKLIAEHIRRVAYGEAPLNLVTE